MKKSVDFFGPVLYNNSCVTDKAFKSKSFGVWLSLARAPGLGPGGRRFESCHPDFLFLQVNNSRYAGVVQW